MLALESAVEDRMVSDVPIGCFLSGGIDSAIVASIARNHGKIDTFTACFEESRFDESQLASHTAKFLDTNHHEVKLKRDDQLNIINQLFSSALDEPFGDSSALPYLFVSSAIKNQATVALSGDGADELFGGYKKYQGELATKYWRLLPISIRQTFVAISRHLPKSHTNGLTDIFRQLEKFINGAEKGTLERHAAWMEVASSSPDIKSVIKNNKHNDLIQMLESIAVPKSLDPLSATLLRDS